MQINVAFRDHCAKKLIELNDCRRENYYLPWSCNHEKHSYEKCQYKECVHRSPMLNGKPRENLCTVCLHMGGSQWQRASKTLARTASSGSNSRPLVLLYVLCTCLPVAHVPWTMQRTYSKITGSLTLVNIGIYSE